MRNLSIIFLPTFVFAIASVSLWKAIANQQDSYRQPTDQLPAKKQQDESFDLRLARAHVELAKLDLLRFEAANKRIPNSFSAEVIEKLKLHVALDEADLEQRLQGKKDDAHQVCIRGAEASVKFAELDLKRTDNLYKQLPTKNNAMNVQRAKMVMKIAKLNLAMAKI